MYELKFYLRLRIRKSVQTFFSSSESAKSKIKTIDQNPLLEKTPKFVTKLLDGENFDIAKYQGKVVVLDFWATGVLHVSGFTSIDRGNLWF